MMTSSRETKNKLQQVLQLFLTPDYNVVTTTYLDLLLGHIVSEIKNGNQEIMQIILKWIISATNTWNESFKPCQSVITFTIKLIGAVSENEITFLNLHLNNVHNKICELFEFQKPDLNVSIKMAFTIMLTNLLEHQTGRQWIAETKAWKEILKFAQANNTMYVTKDSRKFLAVLLVQECNNKSLCEEIILAVTEPLIKATTNQDFTLTDKNVLFEQNNLLLMTMELLLVIMDYATFYNLENTIPEMFEQLTNLENRVSVTFEVTISTPMMQTVHKLSKLLIFTKLRSSLKTIDSSTTDIDDKIFRQFYMGLYYNSMILLSKKYILELMISKKLGIIYWKKLKKLRDLETPKPYKFEIQGIALMILPLCVTMKPKYIKEHYLFEEFLEKIFDVTSTQVQRMAYSIRDVILKNDFPMEDICKSTVDHLLEIIDIIDRDTAVITFQTMCHAIKNFVHVSKDSVDQTERVEDSPIYQKRRQMYKIFLDGDPINDKKLLLAALLNGLNVLTEKFKLKWQECVETICVLSIAQDILNHPGVDQKICTLALKTCKLSIENFMPPNLALLVDLDEQTKQLGPTLFRRLHDPNWQTQDSVLEILKTIAYLSESKYPPYQDFLLENRFIEVAIQIIKNDNESYVKASALSFISTAVQINRIWEKLLHQLDLPELAIKMIYEESEAVARREAVVLLTELYKYRKWPSSMINSMSQAMTAASVLDLHWEVKVNALEYWRHFIKSHLTDQGMLDGHFPKVTFSKANRKIVSLDQVAIMQRLNEALDELARQQCLGVLLVTLKDESDFEVAKVSANIIEDLRRILLQYKMDEPMPEPTPAKDSAIIDSNYIKQPPQSPEEPQNSSEERSQDVIQNIVNTTDANLLISMYRNSMSMESNELGSTSKETLEYVKTVTRKEFLRRIMTFDLAGYIKERSEWLKNHTTSFDSVLDDIILVSEKKDVNTMDCY